MDTNLDNSAGYAMFSEVLKSTFMDRTATPAWPWKDSEIYDWFNAEWTLVDLFGAAPQVPSYISPAFVEIARQGAEHVAAVTLDVPDARPDGISFRTQAIARAGLQGFATVLCPFTGERKRVEHSIGPIWTLLRHGEDFCLASNMGSPMVDVHLETVWVFPQHKLILKTNINIGDHFVWATTGGLFNRVFRFQPELIDHLKRPAHANGDSVHIYDFHCPHIGHNLWNIQSAWFNIFEKISPSRFSSIINLKDQNFYGALPELYPDKFNPGPGIVELQDEDVAFLHCLKTGGLALTVKDEIFRPGFSQTILKRARSQCSPEFLDGVAKLRAQSDPLVVATIRLDNRAWIEQREGLPQLFSALRQDFPALGVIVDGLNSDTVKGWSTAWMSLEADLEIAQALKDGIPEDMPIAFAVGRTFAEALVLCEAADCFIGPVGAGMTIHKWLNNLPGLAFSNRTVMHGVLEERWTVLKVYFDKMYREDMSPTHFVAPEFVVDGPLTHDDAFRANFHMDWTQLHKQARRMIEDLAPPRNSQRHAG